MTGPIKASVFALVVSLSAWACGGDSATGGPTADTALTADSATTDSAAVDGSSPSVTCTSAAACSALNEPAPLCQRWGCVLGGCALAPASDGERCQPADPCLTVGSCRAGACAGAVARECDDGNPCTEDSCEPGRGCVSVAIVGPCDDGDPCTSGDLCAGGVCVSGEPLACDDGDLCTLDDRCDDGACVFTAPPPCDDGDPCTVGDACVPSSGACRGATFVDCECDEDADCARLDDEDLCNGGLICVAHRCEVDADSIISCPAIDLGPCTQDACDPATGECRGMPSADGEPCSSGASCLTDGRCAQGSCAERDLDCDDSDPCTADGCGAEGCVHTPDPSCVCVGDLCAPVQVGDALLLTDVTSHPVETVEAVISDGHVFTCGGFGLDASRLADGGALIQAGEAPAVGRCQNLTVGPLLASGRQLIFASHRGDAYLSSPSLFVLRWDVTAAEFDGVTSSLTLPGVGWEGSAWDPQSGLLWVAAHGQGVFRYSVDLESGALTLVDQRGGLDNAWRLAISGERAWVADGGGGLKVLERATRRGRRRPPRALSARRGAGAARGSGAAPASGCPPWDPA